MKKYLVITIIIISLIITQVLATEHYDSFKKRLNKNDVFYAIFEQKILDIEDNIIQEAKGELWLKYPNLCHIHTINPESFFISDGKNLWNYYPILKQVMIFSLQKKELKNIVILTDFYFKPIYNKSYQINKNDDIFIFIPKNKESHLKMISIHIDKKGIIQYFNLWEKNGTQSVYELKNQKFLKKEDSSIFNFKLPKDVTVENFSINI
ncbi:outer membrane lipoprotein chaperone LolA [Candidatus Schneideria nysicola]|uniref:outer membrane lipoprotein chaperone LolA n=1 Tax=Candidatus Schneideria nysicola TaxID=1081631 RepID=UPI001CAA5E5C|nr:outer membrane lipoprotein chaperone LolA [Candidatus Schneideria nysicola]UAJ66279.1 outer membrane lipoprotein chaperone LolA [Candidatus Schneideria nysicola]